MHEASHFQQLMAAAVAQREPHQLLFLFASAEVPDHASPEQRARHAAGRGGALTPLMCVDKAPEDLASFDALREESRHAGPEWQVVFVAALGGQGGKPPTRSQIDEALEMMVRDLAEGRAGRFAAYDAQGEHLHLG